MSPICYLIITVCAGASLGRLARGLWRTRDLPFLDRTTLDLSMGLGLLSLVLFAMASAHLLFAPVPLVVLTIFGAIGVWLLLGDCVVSTVVWLKQKHRLSLTTCVWAFLFICLAAVVLVPAMAPPSGSDWDSLAYHLSIPKLYLQHGGFYYIDWSSHSNFPFLVEMLYTPALALNDPAGAKMVHYLYGVLLVLAVAALARKHFHPNAGPLAALALLSVPLVLWEATTAYIDLATALYTVVAVYLLLDCFDKAELRSLVGCGIATGFAASTKMTGLTLIPLLALWLLIDRWFACRRIEWKAVLVFCGVAFLTCSPWYIKSFIYTGNPVYPFFYSVFGGKDWTAELAQNYTVLQSKFGVGHNVGSFLMLPWDLTVHSERFYDTSGLLIGPIVLIAAPLLVVARYKSRKLLGLTLFFLAQVAIWFKLTQQSRYLIPTFAVLAVIIAAIVFSDERFRISRKAMYVVFAASALLGVLTLIPSVRSAAPVVFGSETRDEYLTRTLPIYAAESWINEHTGIGNKVALFGDTRGFYLDRPYVWADPGHNRRFTREYESTNELVSRLKSQGVTYALIDYRFFPPPRGAGGTAKLVYQAIESGRFEQTFGDEFGRAAVYKIR